MQEEYVPKTDVSLIKIMYNDEQAISDYKAFKQYCYKEGIIKKETLQKLKGLCENKPLRRITKYNMLVGLYNKGVKID